MGKDLYVFLGPPGAGKGSLSTLCTIRLGWKQLSTGNLCRSEISCGSVLGQQMDLLIKSGKLVPDNLVVAMIEKAIKENAEDLAPIILDGFPRTSLQAQALGDLITEKAFASFRIMVVRMCILNDTLIERLVNRVICQNKSCQAVYSKAGLAQEALDLMICELCSSRLVQRDDDNAIVAQKRLEYYYAHERDIIDYAKRREWPLFDLEVERSIEEVFADFKRIVGIETESLS